MPLIVEERRSSPLAEQLRIDRDMFVWWGTYIECMSAISRREREGSLDPVAATETIRLLSTLQANWTEVDPSDVVRDIASRLLRVHPLKAADALQLAAGVVAAESNPPTLPFVTLDERLALAAGREGFRVLLAP